MTTLPGASRVAEALLEQQRHLGRPVEYRNYWETTFYTDDRQRTFAVLIYEAPWTDAETQAFLGTEVRYAVYENGHFSTGGTIAADTREPS